MLMQINYTNDDVRVLFVLFQGDNKVTIFTDIGHLTNPRKSLECTIPEILVAAY